MKTQELRIGNYVTINNPNCWLKLKDIPMIVTGVNNHMDRDDLNNFPHSDGKISLKLEYETYGQYSQFIEPIFLTEKWILDFGFVYDEFCDCFMSNGYLIEKIGDLFLDRKYGKVITYVHQLQNIYLLFTDKELVLKS